MLHFSYLDALVDLGDVAEVDLLVFEIDFVDLDFVPLGIDFVAVEIDIWEYLTLK